jgi:hypothetical protein
LGAFRSWELVIRGFNKAEKRLLRSSNSDEYDEKIPRPYLTLIIIPFDTSQFICTPLKILYTLPDIDRAGVS